jgi:hypothetical protein
VTTQRDRSGQPYVEVPTSADEKVRVTYIERADWVGGEPTIRIQKRDAKGRTVFGPEVPADKAMDLIAAISQLVHENRKVTP